jgi:hypothetical protein
LHSHLQVNHNIFKQVAKPLFLATTGGIASRLQTRQNIKHPVHPIPKVLKSMPVHRHSKGYDIVSEYATFQKFCPLKEEGETVVSILPIFVK